METTIEVKDEINRHLSKILKVSLFKELFLIFILVLTLASGFTGLTYFMYDLHKRSEERIEKIEKQQEQTNQMILGVAIKLNQQESPNWEK